MFSCLLELDWDSRDWNLGVIRGSGHGLPGFRGLSGSRVTFGLAVAVDDRNGGGGWNLLGTLRVFADSLAALFYDPKTRCEPSS